MARSLPQNLRVGRGVEPDDQRAALAERRRAEIPRRPEEEREQLRARQLVALEIEVHHLRALRDVDLLDVLQDVERGVALDRRLLRVGLRGDLHALGRKKLLRLAARGSARAVIAPVDGHHRSISSGPPACERAHEAGELPRVDRFAHVPVEARGQRALGGVDVVEARHRDDGPRGAGGDAPQRREDPVPVVLRHDDVAHDHVRQDARDAREPRLRGGRRGDERAAIREDRGEELAGFAVVVDDQDVDPDERLARQRIAAPHQPVARSVEITRQSSPGLSGSARCAFTLSGAWSWPARRTATIGMCPPSSGLRLRTLAGSAAAAARSPPPIVMTRASGFTWFIARSASSAVATAVTSAPQYRRSERRTSRNTGSSSTTSTWTLVRESTAKNPPRAMARV